jgi:rod shape-determining protein MreD
MSFQFVRYAIISLLLVVVQTTLIRAISLGGIVPDLLVIWIVYTTLHLGQLRGTLWGFAIGLFMDLITGDFLGLSAFAKTLTGFLAGYFYNENKALLTLGSYRFLLIVLLVSFVHNILYFFILTLGTDINFGQAVLYSGITTTLYTTTLSLLPMFILQRKLSM